MSAAVGTHGLVDVALATLPQDSLRDTLITFARSHHAAFDCGFCVIVLAPMTDKEGADPTAVSVPPLPPQAGDAGRLLDHCRLTFRAAGNGDVLPVSEELGVGKHARHFRISDFGWLLLTEDSTLWNEPMHEAYLRILQSLSSSLHQAHQHEIDEETRLKLTLASRAAGAGFFEWNTHSNEMIWDAGMRKLFSVSSDNFSGTIDDFTRRLHPESREAVLEQLETFLAHGGDETAEFSFYIVTDLGEKRRVTSHALQIRNRSGTTSVIGIGYDISELELARTQSLYCSDFESLLLNLSMRLIKPLEEDFNHIVQEVLRDVALFVNADRAYIFEYDMQAGDCSNTHEWCAEGVSPELDNLQNIPVTALHYWLAAHEKGQPFILRGVSDLPPEHPLRQILEPQGVQSLATFPLMHGERLEGFIGFDAVSYERRWSEVDTSILKLLAQLLVNARDKARAEQLIQDSEAKLRLSRDRAEQLAHDAVLANRAKTDFIARVSHEVRTPLHAINGLANMLIEGVPAPERTDYLQTILASGESMLELINDILDFTRIDSKGITLNQEPIDLHTLLQHLLAMFTPMATEKLLTLDLQIADEVPQWVIGDQLRIQQILQNLLSNAVKFTDQGSITISAAIPDADSDRRVIPISLCVHDTGMGIPEQEFDNLFMPFFQLNDAASINRGTGLGLPITRTLAELMGGDISVESRPGEGSRFCANILLEQVAGDHQTTRAAVPISNPSYSVDGLRVLLAEDNPVNTGLVQLYLRGSGVKLDLATNGVETCDLHQNNGYDVILMDCEMPVMDGFKATRRIRDAETGASRQTPIIGVTANALDEDISRCLRAGMNSVLSKPFNKSQLLQQLTNLPGSA